MTARFPGAGSGERSEATSELFAGFDSLVIGPGLGRQEGALARVSAGLEARLPTVLDADGLRAVEGHLEELREHPALVLTPHVGEAAGLLGISSEQVEKDRFRAARELAQRSGASVVLKGPRTLIARPDGVVVVSAFGNAALSTGGTGDVLSGIIAGLIATASRRSGFEPARVFELTWQAVALHGLSAEAWASENGTAGMLAGDLLEFLPKVTQRLVDHQAPRSAV
jgi:NAD(P)H-hydrate epimerase